MKGTSNPLAKLNEFGNVTVSMESSNQADLSICGNDMGYVTLPEGPSFNINIETDAAGFKRLQEALKNTEQREEDRTIREINTMHEVLNTEGKTIQEKADNYIEKKEKAMNNKVEECLKKKKRKAIPHYRIKYR